MRTTLNLDDGLLRRARAEATRSGRTLTAVIEDAVREALARTDQPTDHEPYRVQPFEGRGLRAGVDLDDTAALLDHMDDHR